MGSEEVGKEQEWIDGKKTMKTLNSNKQDVVLVLNCSKRGNHHARLLCHPVKQFRRDLEQARMLNLIFKLYKMYIRQRPV